MEYNFEWDAWSPQYCSVSALGLESRPFWTGGFFRQYGGGQIITVRNVGKGG